MGSLLPGWDESAPGVAPKGFQEFSDEDEQLGYFAAYEKMKKEQRDAGDTTGRPLPRELSRRISMPINLGRRSLPISESGPMSPSFFTSRSYKEAPEFGSLRQPPRLQRLTSMPITAGESFDFGTPKAPPTPKSPLSGSLSGSPPSRTGHSLDQYKTHKEQHHEVQWWRNFDSAHLNEMPDVPHEKDKGYVPQFTVAGQKPHYRGLEEAPKPVTPAKEKESSSDASKDLDVLWDIHLEC